MRITDGLLLVGEELSRVVVRREVETLTRES